MCPARSAAVLLKTAAMLQAIAAKMRQDHEMFVDRRCGGIVCCHCPSPKKTSQWSRFFPPVGTPPPKNITRQLLRTAMLVLDKVGATMPVLQRHSFIIAKTDGVFSTFPRNPLFHENFLTVGGTTGPVVRTSLSLCLHPKKTFLLNLDVCPRRPRTAVRFPP